MLLDMQALNENIFSEGINYSYEIQRQLSSIPFIHDDVKQLIDFHPKHNNKL